MEVFSRWSRRRFLVSSSLATAAAALPLMSRADVAATKTPGVASSDFVADVEIDLVAHPDSVQILDGAATNVWRYAATLAKGPEGTLTSLPNSYLGPIMRFAKGQKIRIRLRNDLPEHTIAHWHGLHVPMEADGHPSAAIEPGQTYVYEFEMRNRASLNFYHPHTHEATATQVYRGLAGAIIVNDEEERALNLPAGEFELPIVIQDRSLNASNQWIYAGDMHSSMTGFYGDRILVNGRPNYSVDVASRAYRLRVLNGSNARIYKLMWDDGSPITILGVDGGLFEAPETKPYVMLAPAERLDIWADFSGKPVGAQLVMRSGGFHGVLPAMAERMGRMMGGGTNLPVGSEFPIFTVRVTRTATDSPALPKTLSKIVRYRLEDTVNPNDPVPLAISEAPMAMLLNGRPYAMNDAQPRERIPVGSVQLMEIFHNHGEGGGRGHGMGMGRGGMGMMGGGMGMMLMMAHPIHLHGQYFQILSRTYEGEDADDYATMREGLVSSGFKDTVLTLPGERIRIIKPFQDFKGAFMYHCHNLEHEDMGMMREFQIE